MTDEELLDRIENLRSQLWDLWIDTLHESENNEKITNEEIDELKNLAELGKQLLANKVECDECKQDFTLLEIEPQWDTGEYRCKTCEEKIRKACDDYEKKCREAVIRGGPYDKYDLVKKGE